jgi:hypothetical protein
LSKACSLFVLLAVSNNLKGFFCLDIMEFYKKALILEVYEPGFGVKIFGGSNDFQ